MLEARRQLKLSTSEAPRCYKVDTKVEVVHRPSEIDERYESSVGLVSGRAKLSSLLAVRQFRELRGVFYVKVPLWCRTPRMWIKCLNIRFELEKGLAVLEFNDPVL